ncbi:MAG: arylesterase [Xanthomonadales bacterium]|nr:arylesterase [Gammaproteobacteria bacterium]MBT8053932.1 arylesterase [Gammaproteobacteria bacterium]NND58273.1 arylesterase [Xanthomonadales bacterium]NNK52016.1 arylesterase [Xanthomonadales bacterium]
MRLFSILLFFAVTVVAAANHAGLQAATGSEREPVIVVLGDSLSAAYGMEISQSWPSLLQARLHENGYAYRVFNSSITGDTTQGGLARLPRLLEKYRPDIVILELGGNDGLRGLPVEVTRENLASMIEQSQAAGASVILAEMRIPPNYGLTYTEKFNANYMILATQYDITLLPFVLQDIALEDGLMQADGIHPTAEAQPAILDQVWPVLSALLPEHDSTGSDRSGT